MIGNFGFGSRVYPGLAKLVEEAGEVQQVAGKLIMTNGEPNHWDGSDLSVRIAEEVADLSGACRAFFQLNGYDGAPWVLEREIAKWQQFLEWHAENLEDNPDDVPVVMHRWNRFQKAIGCGSDLHYEIYWAWRVYPEALKTGMLAAFGIGCLLTNIIWLFVR